MLRTRMVSETPGTPGRKRADAAHDEVDRHAGLRGAVERLDDPRLGEGVHARLDARGPAGARLGGLGVDQLDQPAVEA